jgi:uncharacterized protein YbaA (DUF1428 family)
MPYIDGFIIAVPKKNIDAYRKISRKAGKIWREFGALDYREAVADDVQVGKVTSFPRAVKQKPDETVIFAYILYKSRRDRDRINKKVMADPRLAKMMTPGAMPFDGKRMIFAGSRRSWICEGADPASAGSAKSHHAFATPLRDSDTSSAPASVAAAR